MCRIASLFLLQGSKGNMSDEARDFNNIDSRAVIKFFFFLSRQGAEGNSRHSDRNIRDLRKLEQRAKKCIELRGEYVE